jgi:hypothetical protein
MNISTILLRKGETYFCVGFFDPDLQVPCIATYIYCGMDDVDHLFMNAEGYLAKQTGESCENTHYITYKDGKVRGMLDRENLISWLQEEHSPQKIGRTYRYQSV